MRGRAISLTCLVAITVLAGTAVLIAPAQSADPTVTARDARGDVRITRAHSMPVTPAERRSIDIRKVTVTPLTARAVRISVTIGEALRTRDFDQMVFVDLTPAASSTGGWVSANLGWSPQKPRKWAYASVDLGTGEYENCVAKRIRSDYATNTLSADIPNQCIPTGPAKVAVSTLTGQFRTDADVYSRDALKIRGPQTLR